MLARRDDPYETTTLPREITNSFLNRAMTMQRVIMRIIQMERLEIRRRIPVLLLAFGREREEKKHFVLGIRE